MNKHIIEFLEKNKIIPIATIEKAEDAIPIAKAIMDANLNVIEVTLRTPNALDYIKEMRKHFPKLFIIAGTIITETQITEAKSAGADCLISPGYSKKLIRKAQLLKIPYIPAISTISEAMLAREDNCKTLKFFPAELSGGIEMLKKLNNILPDISFIPTGGISENNIESYMKQSNVLATAGSFLVPKETIKTKNWYQIEKICKSVRQKIC